MKQKAFSKYLIAFGLAAMILVPLSAFAQLNRTYGGLTSGFGGDPGLFQNIFGCASNQGALCLLRNILNFILSIAFITAVIFLIIGGFRYVTSQGNEDGIEKAKGTITNAVIGIVVIVLAWIILTLVLNLVQTGNA